MRATFTGGTDTLCVFEALTVICAAGGCAGAFAVAEDGVDDCEESCDGKVIAGFFGLDSSTLAASTGRAGSVAVFAGSFAGIIAACCCAASPPNIPRPF